MAHVRTATTFRKTRHGEACTLFPEPRDQMRPDGDVWLRMLGTKGYLCYFTMTTEAALALVVEILKNISHRHDVDEAIEALIQANRSPMIESIYQAGHGELFEAIYGKGADVVNLNDGDGGDDAA